jgi:aerobic carbon-monoxide dehydrogenase small subunit
MEVTITINGERVSREVEPRLLLVHFIRDTPGLTGTHWGCDTSNCGACVVLMDGKPIKSCTTLAAMCVGHEIRTVESLEVDDRLDPVQTGFHEKHGLHCGFCTPHGHCSMRIPTRPRPRSGRRSRARSAVARATRTSSARCAGRPSTRPR